ncbi:MAG: hypothetical protein R3230_01200 [Nitrosopumilaceae archaeon]|nr:hypothetical protein [Nitrosopumilaceae archaeon]
MAQWTLADIRRKVRQVTGRYSSDEIINEQLDEYINRYFQYTFPAEVKLDRFETYYDFITLANQQSYDFPTGYINFEPLGTIDYQTIYWYQDPSRFWDMNVENVNRITLGTGDGATVSFSGTASSFPLLPGKSIITDGIETFEDTTTTYTTNTINLTGSLGGTGTLNLSTGAVSVTFNSAPASGTNIYFSYIQFQAGRPTSVLIYNNQFTFFPVPDTSYRFRCQAYANTLVTTASGTTATEFTNATDRPLLDEWGPTIAYGTSRNIHADYGEMDAYAEVTALYKEQIGYILTRTCQNLLNTRATPQF